MATTEQETPHFLDYWRVVVSRKEVVISVALLVILTGVLVTYSLPRVYMAATKIQVKEEQPDVPVFTPEILRWDPLFLRTQFEIIQSRPVIEEVVRRLNLNERLGRAYGYLDKLGEASFEQTLRIVRSQLKVHQYRDTHLIEIQMYMDEPKGSAHQLAAETANEIAIVYRDRNMRRTRQLTERGLNALLESLEDQRRRVEAAERSVAEIQRKYDLTIVSWAAGKDSALLKMSMTQIEQERIRLRMELEDRKARYDTVMSLSPDKLLEAGPYLVKDPALVTLVAEKRGAEVERNRLLESLGPRHPDVVKVRATISELDIKIKDALAGLKTGVQAEYESVQAKNQALEEMLAQLKASDQSAEAEGYREYETAVAELERMRRVLDALEMRYAQEGIEMRIPSTTVEIVEEAKAPSENAPVRPIPILNVILSVVVGLGGGVALAFFVEYLDTSVKTIGDIEKMMGTTVLGVIPQKVKAFCDPESDAGQAEAYRVLRTNLRFAKNLSAGKALCVTSGSVGEGKSLTVFNLAYVSAEQGERVLIVDADLHRPRQHKILGIDNRPGLANVLVNEAALSDAIRSTGVKNLDILPSGKLQLGVHGLLLSDRMQDILDTVRERYDVVIFDSPPMIGVSDASLIARQVDGVIQVIQHRKYPKAVSMRARDMINNFGGNLLGVVLNNINFSRDYTYYYYQHHYSYYPQDAAKRRASGKDARERRKERRAGA